MTSLWQASHPSVPTRPVVPGGRFDVIVVGAGITGLCTALMLAEAGQRVAVLEAREIGALATGNTTGKISLLQGSRLSTIRAHHPRSVLRAYADSNRDGQEWLLAFCERAGVAVQRRTAYSYAQQPGDRAASAVEAEYHAAREAGLPVSLVEGGRELDPPFPFVYGVALAEQAQFDAMEALGALAAAVIRHGGRIHQGVRVTGVRVRGGGAGAPDERSRVRVRTSAGELFAARVVLATATPILDRGLYFAKTHGQRSYGLSFELPEAGTADSATAVGWPLPEGLFLSIGDPDGRTRSLRTAPVPGGPDQLVVGGNGHGVGRAGAFTERQRLDDLEAYVHGFAPGARATHRWSAQDYESHNLIPFVGALPRGRGRVSLATGFAKWGLTNGVAAALRLRDEILGVPRAGYRSWHRVLGTRLTLPADLGRGAAAGAQVGAELAGGWLGAVRSPVPVPRPAEGQGVVASTKGRPVGVSTVEGRTCAVSAVCPHLGGVLVWNDAERSWDCPLHASRFAADGTRLEGPAVTDLRRLPRVPPAAS